MDWGRNAWKCSRRETCLFDDWFLHDSIRAKNVWRVDTTQKKCNSETISIRENKSLNRAWLVHAAYISRRPMPNEREIHKKRIAYGMREVHTNKLHYIRAISHRHAHQLNTWDSSHVYYPSCVSLNLSVSLYLSFVCRYGPDISSKSK